jgi:release factor glutamine methyltransferase
MAPERLPLHVDGILTDTQQKAFSALIVARMARQPVSQIIGSRAFWGRRFAVTRDTLDPRPETECLVESCLDLPFARVLDLGTGTGCILLTLLAERPSATGVGTDVSQAALDVANTNAQSLGVHHRAIFVASDWFASVTGTYDLIVSNPPYIASGEMACLAPEVHDWEPHLALTPGGDGLDAYRAIAAGAARHLASGGCLLVEIGPSQGSAVVAILQASGFATVSVRPDLDGRDRVVMARK